MSNCFLYDRVLSYNLCRVLDCDLESPTNEAWGDAHPDVDKKRVIIEEEEDWESCQSLVLYLFHIRLPLALWKVTWRCVLLVETFTKSFAKIWIFHQQVGARGSEVQGVTVNVTISAQPGWWGLRIIRLYRGAKLAWIQLNLFRASLT